MKKLGPLRAPPLQLRKLIAKLYGPSLLSSPIFASSPPSSPLQEPLFSFSLPIRRRRIPPRFTASLASSKGRRGAPVGSTDTTQKRGRFKPIPFPSRRCHLNRPIYAANTRRLSLSLLLLWSQFISSLLGAFRLLPPLSPLICPSRKLLGERGGGSGGLDRLGDREIPSDIMPPVFHGR